METSNQKEKMFEFVDLLGYINQNTKGIFFKGISKSHLIIYAIIFVISVALIIPYIFCQNAISSIAMSIGASGIGAVILGFLIELSTNKDKKAQQKQEWNNMVNELYCIFGTIFLCHSSLYMKNFIGNEKSVIATQYAKKISIQLNIAKNKIDSLIFYSGSVGLNLEALEFLQILSNQMIQFIGSLEKPIDIDNLIDVLEGIRLWLGENCSEKNIKQLIIF